MNRNTHTGLSKDIKTGLNKGKEGTTLPKWIRAIIDDTDSGSDSEEQSDSESDEQIESANNYLEAEMWENESQSDLEWFYSTLDEKSEVIARANMLPQDIKYFMRDL